MPVTEALRILIDADSRGAVRGIEAVGKATDRELGRSQKRIDAWSRGLTTAGAGMVAFGAASLIGLGKAAQASEQANLAVVKLDNTLSNMPKLAGENSKSFIDLANAIQDKTAADADQIVEAQALLGTFQLTGDEIRKITPLVVDYSRKFGVDMTDAAKQVGKALDGQIGALRRSGVSIDENLFKTDRYAAVTQALRDQVGGFAEQEGKTFAGSLERLKNQLGDVAEGVGTGAVDAFASLFGTVEGGIDKIKELSPSTQEAIGKFATFGSVALIAAGGLSFTIGQLSKMKQNFDIARTAIADFAGAGGLGRLARVGVAIGGLIALREILGTIKDDIEDVNVGELELELLRLGRSGEVAGEQLGRILGGDGPLAQGFKNMDEFSTDAIQFRQDIDALDDALAQLAARDPAAAAAAFREITAALEDQGIPAARVREEFDSYRDAVAGAKVNAESATGGVDALTGAMGEQADETGDAVSQLQEYSDQLRAMTDPLFGAMDALQGTRDAQLAYRDAVVGVMEAQATLDEAIANHGPNSDEAADATRGLEDAQRKLSDAQWATVESAAQADSALAGLKDAVDRGDVSVDDFKSTLAQWVQQGFLTQQQADQAARSVGGLAAEAEDADKKRVDIPVATPGSEPSRERLLKVKDAVGLIPNSKHVNVTASSNVARVVDGVLSQLNRIPSLTRSVIEFQTRGGLMPGQQVRQHGGPVRKGEAYIVGEQRPEVFVPDRNGMILPSVNQLGHMGGGGAGGYVDNRIINITTGADPQAVVAALRRAGDMGLPITIRGRSL